MEMECLAVFLPLPERIASCVCSLCWCPFIAPRVGADLENGLAIGSVPMGHQQEMAYGKLTGHMIDVM